MRLSASDPEKTHQFQDGPVNVHVQGRVNEGSGPAHVTTHVSSTPAPDGDGSVHVNAHAKVSTPAPVGDGNVHVNAHAKVSTPAPDGMGPVRVHVNAKVTTPGPGNSARDGPSATPEPVGDADSLAKVKAHVTVHGAPPPVKVHATVKTGEAASATPEPEDRSSMLDSNSLARAHVTLHGAPPPGTGLKVNTKVKVDDSG